MGTRAYFSFPIAQATQDQVNAAVAHIKATPDPYLRPLRDALRAKFALIPPADSARFWGVYTDISDAFDMHQSESMIRDIIQNVTIGTGQEYPDGSIDPENRPDLYQLQQDMLSLPEWTA